MSSERSARDALDYPTMDGEKFVIWFGNEHLWPDARRQTHYVCARTDALKGYALLTILPEDALVFDTEGDARGFLQRNEALRGRPYRGAQVTTIADLKIARGYTLPENVDGVPTP